MVKYGKNYDSNEGEKMPIHPPRWYHSEIGCGVAVLLAGLGIGGCMYLRDLNANKVSENRQGVSRIESEMNDGDNEPIELKGIYRDNIFEIWSVSANGHKIVRK